MAEKVAQADHAVAAVAAGQHAAVLACGGGAVLSHVNVKVGRFQDDRARTSICGGSDSTCGASANSS
jgi:hypothetical protein